MPIKSELMTGFSCIKKYKFSKYFKRNVELILKEETSIQDVVYACKTLWVEVFLQEAKNIKYFILLPFLIIFKVIAAACLYIIAEKNSNCI